MDQDLVNMTVNIKSEDYNKMRSSNSPNTGHSSTSVLDHNSSLSDDTDLSSTSPISPAPICRQFWKAGYYEEGLASNRILQNSGSYLHIHPKFLHSNATSHKWAFGAIAELLDNAVDEIQNGATQVVVDKTLNPRDGRPALLIQDDGGGMDPEGMRRCLSFGFSDKKSKSAIGHYGNGFKTSSMRLGADVIVFTRCSTKRKKTQSIGLLSYTFLIQNAYERIVVPMVDYEYNYTTMSLDLLDQSCKSDSVSNLSLLLQWSPYSTEDELLEQCDGIGDHGTKIIIYNLWCTDEGVLELDFDSDPEDIRLKEVTEKGPNRLANKQHMAYQHRFSLRVYLSILYLRTPDFTILLCGKVVLYHNIGSDLKHPQFILYRPHGTMKGEIITTIGFLKEAPHVNVHGFNVYHKNRLILPFWEVVNRNNGSCRGVVGLLEANFIQPTHNKQDFEKTSVFQKLEVRLKAMTMEYWRYHCGLIGYNNCPRKTPASPVPARDTSNEICLQPVVMYKSFSKAPSKVPVGPQLKRKEGSNLSEPGVLKKRATTDNGINESASPTGDLLGNSEAATLMQENKKLQARWNQCEIVEEELNLKVTQLRNELKNVEQEYARLLAESQILDKKNNVKSVMMR